MEKDKRIEELERELSRYKKGFTIAAMRLKKLGQDPKELLNLLKSY